MKNEHTYYHTLPNGIRIVHKQTPSKVAWLGLMTGAGTRDESAELNGMAHYIEHTVFKGTATRSAKDIINRIEAIGGELNAYTTKEETTFYAAVPEQYFARATELIADMVFNPSFPTEETKKELGVIYDEIESYNDSPSELIYEDFENLLFEGHPLEMPILGTKKSLKHISKQKTRDFMQNNYCTEETVFFSLSSLPMSKVTSIAERYLSETPYSKSRAHMRLSPGSNEPRTAYYHRHTHQTHVMAGGRAYPIGHERQAALYLLNNIVGGGSMNSRLNMSLREQRGLVYNIESSYTPLSDTGYWCVYFASEPQYAEQCEELVRKELKKLCKKPLSTSTFQRALKQLHGQTAIAAENRENSALRIAKLMLYGNEAPTWEEKFEEIARLTPAILCETAREIFNPDKLSTLRYQ